MVKFPRRKQKIEPLRAGSRVVSVLNNPTLCQTCLWTKIHVLQHFVLHLQGCPNEKVGGNYVQGKLPKILPSTVFRKILSGMELKSDIHPYYYSKQMWIKFWFLEF